MKKAQNIHDEKYIHKSIEIESIISLFEADYKNPYYFPGEFHPFWELVYVLDGEINVAGDEKVYILHEGDIIFHKPMEFHKLWTSKDKDIHAFIAAFRAKGPLVSNFEGLVLSLPAELEKDIKRLLSYAGKKFFDKNGQYHRKMFESWQIRQDEIQIIVNMLEIFLLSVLKKSKNINFKSTVDTGVSEVYREIVNKLNENIYGSITLKDLAEQCNFSISQIKRVFSKYSDIGIHKYFLKLKIATAIRMLGQGVHLNEISKTLAFSSQNYFSWAFKRETGLSPSDYKSKILNITD